MDNKRYIDASSTQDGLVRYINHCRSGNRKKKECKRNNTRFSVKRDKSGAYIKTTHKVKKGKEFFVSYGSDYWKKKR